MILDVMQVTACISVKVRGELSGNKLNAFTPIRTIC